MSDLAIELEAFGDRAWRFSVPSSLDRRALLAALLAIEGIVDVVLAEDHGAAIIDDETHRERVARALAFALGVAPAATAGARDVHTIRVAYDGEDLPALALRLNLTTDALIELHAGRDYDVAMLGFMPGFAYLRGLDPRLILARRDSPRTRVPARSVALAAGYTGIYPFSSPGGWHLLGEAIDFTPFDDRGAALAVGDCVRFEPIARASGRAQGLASPPSTRPPDGPWLEVRAARGPALLVDGGRPGHMHEGVPHGGPMVRSAMASANAAAGNPRGACAVELYGELELVARGGRVTVGDDIRGATELRDGDVFAVSTSGRARVRYVAVHGGLDVPFVLGGRGTMLLAGLGGLEGRALRRGDRLNPNAHAATVSRASAKIEREADAGAVALMPGPDATDADLDALVRATFTIRPASDRTGTRLDGPLPPSHVYSTHDRRSGPMVRGAIERTPAGLIVLGPDHPTTGGYPVIAVLREHAMDRFFALPIGHAVSFVRSG